MMDDEMIAELMANMAYEKVKAAMLKRLAEAKDMEVGSILVIKMPLEVGGELIRTEEGFEPHEEVS